MLLQETLYFLICLLAPVVAEQGTCPVAWEEDVAGALHLLQQFQSRTDVFHGVLFAQRMVQVTQYAGCPRLNAPVFGLAEAFEQPVLSGLVGGQGTGDKIELPLAVRIAEA